jgi:predicted enzyme related to lactoylglutathione lyase
MTVKKGIQSPMSQHPGLAAFCWRDLMTTEPEEALAFYSGLFGWELSRELKLGPGFVYQILKNTQGEFGGIARLPRDSGIYPYWISYLQTPDVNATAALALKLGGAQLVPPSTIPGIGRIAVLADPSGAGFALLDAISPAPIVTGRDAVPGSPVWHELITGDFDGAAIFYSELFGYQIERGEETTFAIKRDGQTTRIAGLRAQPQTMPVAAWTIAYRVADLDLARSRVNKLGGENLPNIQELPDGGRTSTVIDPTGAVFTIRELAVD